MNPLEQMVLAWQCLVYTLRQTVRPALWVPWLFVGGLQAIVVGALWWFAHPALSWFMAPLLNLMIGEEALRYPNVFRVMPALYARADFVIGVILGSIIVGASTVLFSACFTGAEVRPSKGLGRAFRRAGPLILANLPVNLLIIGLSYGIELWLANRGSSGTVARMLRLMLVPAAIVIQAFFLYVNALLMLSGRSLLGTLAELPHIAARGMWAALLLALLALAPLLPIQLLAMSSNTLVERGAPELVGWLVLGQVLISLFMSFLLAGSSTLVYQSAAVRPAEDDES